ncbi:histidine kinase [Streptomyces phaeochromogenes]|uniref:sensor histidine kinase n=2 Tax=Streptomyces phaeochromogenes TaxID=1923 RepID=UPI002E2ACD58|nr:histidine kinase [Streptomyces phaeochromogenes]
MAVRDRSATAGAGAGGGGGGAWPRRLERVMAAINRDPLTAPHRTRNDAIFAAGVAVLAVALALLVDDGRRLDPLGWALLLGAHVPLVWRRTRPVLVMLAVVACVAPYHGLDFHHAAPTPASYLALYTVAVTGRPLRTVLVGMGVLGVAVSVMLSVSAKDAIQLLEISGWVVAMLFFGVDVRFYRRYVASIVERAERAERTREEEARRRVAEERLRIARDLHDLLAHSITLIGVQTSVAAHVLTADPERLDRKAVAQALDDIAGTCRTARGELRTTLEVLRAHDAVVGVGTDLGAGAGPGSVSGAGDMRGPLPGIDGLAGLAESGRVAGAKVELSVRADGIPPSVGAAAYRIVQEALTNAVRHGGREDLTVRVGLWTADGALRVSVTDDGTGGGANGGANAGGGAGSSDGTPGFGLVGMRERARSVGGTLDAGPGPAEGFEVTATLPLPREDKAR